MQPGRRKEPQGKETLEEVDEEKALLMPFGALKPRSLYAELGPERKSVTTGSVKGRDKLSLENYGGDKIVGGRNLSIGRRGLKKKSTNQASAEGVLAFRRRKARGKEVGTNSED